MAAKKLSLKALVSAPMAGFRTKLVEVAEWNGAKVILREPSPAGWGQWREIIEPEELKEGAKAVELSITEQTQRNIRADAVMFIDVLLDEDQKPVFTREDLDEVVGFYGPVHSRLLKQALALQTSPEDAEKKSESQKPSS
ncbi:phage tail assembly chaperone [Serratia fonticola]|uniref:phage tail assembly chaperone n=1 Tax=Serratia fonticola TaxID=47917 RepID=UPI0015C62356|nr:phage tail assembly chaperone [Serratia fonticola]MBC3378495.1 phage tail protein [Serratia fonticola]MBP1010777.1 phage tail protein [Serratia fonticola]NYA37695.1 phage tail protein [Serratia fonticola]